MSMHRQSGPLLAALLLALAGHATANEPIEVSTRPLAEILIKTRNEAPASVIARNESQLSAEILASVTSIEAEVGESVEAGAILIRLDCRDAELALSQARAQVAAAEARIHLATQRQLRAHELVKSNHVSADDLLAAETELALAKAEALVQKAQVGIGERTTSKCTIRAPFDGVVRARQAQAGMLATVGTPLLTLVQSDLREVAASVEVGDADGLALAKDLQLLAAGQSWPLKLDRLSELVDPGTRSRQARLHFLQTQAPIGIEGRLSWEDPKPRIPAEWLLRREGRLGVFVVDDGRARFHVLEQAQEGRAALATLPADALLIESGRERVSDGDAVVLATSEG